MYLNDRWLRLAGIPLITLLGDWIFYDEINRQHGWPVWFDYLVGLAEVSLLWTISRFGILQSRRRYPTLSQSPRRVVFQALWFILITSAFRLTTSFIYDITLFWGYHYTPLRYLYNIAVGVFCVIPVAAIYEGLYLYQQWRTSYHEAQELKKMTLQSQLESLREQVKPHFLFNSLNTLQGLVMEDEKEQAVQFIINLSQVYRYLLQSNEQPLITLESELSFVRAYISLLKTRFEQGLALHIDVDADKLAYTLPPLTVQLLVENAVKHNRVSTASPLIIRIQTDAARNIVVTNNRQPKQSTLLSNRMGLSNIAARYRLLNQPDIIIHQTDTMFQVSVPLIKPALP